MAVTISSYIWVIYLTPFCVQILWQFTAVGLRSCEGLHWPIR